MESVAWRSVTSRTTRNHRCDEGFIELLHEDFGIPLYSLQAALIGVPSVSKKEAYSCLRLGGTCNP